MAQPEAHSAHSVGRRRELLTACPEVRSFMDRHFERKICFIRPICFDRPSMSRVLAGFQPQSAPQRAQRATQLAQPPLAPRDDPNLVDLPLWGEYLSDHILASVFNEFQPSPAYQRFVAEDAWPTADDAVFGTPSLLHITACWALRQIIPKFESASCKALEFGSTIPVCALAKKKPLASPVKKGQVPVSVYKLLASVWARHSLCTFEIPEPPNFRQDRGIGIGGTGELPVEWYNSEAKLVGSSTVRRVDLSHSTQPSLRPAPHLRTQRPEQPLSHPGVTSWPMH